MTPEERIAEIEERLEAATPQEGELPWVEVLLSDDPETRLDDLPYFERYAEMCRHAPTDLRYLLERVEELEDVLAFIECNDCDAGGVGSHDDYEDVECPGDRNIRLARQALEAEGESDG